MSMPDVDISKLSEIVAKYSQDELLVSEAYDDAGTEYLWGRLEGGALNQIDGGAAMASRYAIWANTVRDNIIEGLRAMDFGEYEESQRYLIRAANSLSAFSDIQAWLDPLQFGKKP